MMFFHLIRKSLKVLRLKVTIQNPNSRTKSKMATMNWEGATYDICFRSILRGQAGSIKEIRPKKFVTVYRTLV